LNKSLLSFRTIYKNFTPYTLGLLILAIVTPLVYSRALADGTDLPRYALISIIIFISIILFLFSFYKKPTLYFSKIFLIPAGLFFWSMLSILWSVDYGNSYIEVARQFSFLLLLFLAMQIKLMHQQKIIINGAIIACFFVVIIGLLQNININPLNIHYPSLPASTFINPNHASNFIEFFVPILLILIIYTKNNTEKFLYSIALVFSISYLYILSSLGTLIALSVTLLIAGLFLYKHANLFKNIKKNIKYLIIIFISSYLLITLNSHHTTLKNPTSNLTTKSIFKSKSSHTMRLSLYLQSLEAIKSSPLLGFGYGGLRAGLLPFIGEQQQLTKHSENNYYFELHNDFLQQVLETGIIAGIIFFLFFIYIVFIGLNSIKNTKVTEKNIFIFSVSAGLLVIIFHSFVSFPFHLSTSSLLIYLISGFILSLKTKKLYFHTLYKNKLLPLFFLLFFSVVLLFSLIFNLKHIQSNKLIRDAYISLYKEGNCKKAIDLINESNHLFKYDFDNQLNQANIYNHCPQSINKLKINLDKLITLNPTNFKARFLRGRVAILNNELDLAFNHFKFITQMLPFSALGYIGLGDWAYSSNQFNLALAYYEKALNLDSSNTYIQSKIKTLNEKK